jgi:hypothetical protein
MYASNYTISSVFAAMSVIVLAEFAIPPCGIRG